MKLRRLFLFILFFTLFISRSSSQNLDGDIPPYFVDNLTQKISNIEKESRMGASFVFITDTHVKSNEMHSPQLIKYVLDKTSIHTVIWGGDAIMQYGGPIEKQWNIQLRFDSVLNKDSYLYKVRGNHDFSILRKGKSSDKLLLSNKESAKLLFKNSPPNLHRNLNDPGSCYYFFDDNNNNLRFVIFDTTDSVPNKVVSFGNVPYVHGSQLRWIADSAVMTTPKGYGLIFVSHIPIPYTNTTRHPVLLKLRDLVNGIRTKSSGIIGNVKYDFSNLEDVKVLMCIAGHIHGDSERYVNGVLQFTTANDGKWNEESKSKSDVAKRKVGTVSEQCFDCICISKDQKVVHAYRIGYGKDRHFHLDSTCLPVNKTIKLKSMLKGPVNWTILKNKQKVNSEILIVDSGILKGLREGNTTVVARDKKGNKEYFNIVVQ